MTFTFPLPVAALSDILLVARVSWGDQRNDELSGSGDARTWSAELADPLWTGDVSLAPNEHVAAKEVAAKIRKLEGPRHSFFLVDPLSPYPAADPDGSILGSSTVLLNAIGSGREAVTLSGLPVGYVLTIGDKGQLTYSSSPSRNYFFECSETVVANGSGLATFEVFPHVPPLVTTGVTVTLKKPACKGFIMPGTFRSGYAAETLTHDAGFVFMERR